MKLEKKYSIKDMYCLSSNFRNQLITALFILIGVLHFIPEKSMLVHPTFKSDFDNYLFIFAYTFVLLLSYISIVICNDFTGNSFKFEKVRIYRALGSIVLLIIAKHFNIVSDVINYKSATYPILGFIACFAVSDIVVFLLKEFIISIILTFKKLYVTVHKRAFIPLTLEEMKTADIKSMSDYEKVINAFLCYSCSMFGENNTYYVEPLSYIDLVKSGIALYEKLNEFKPIYLNCKFSTFDGFSFVYEESYDCKVSTYDIKDMFDNMFINK